MLHFACNMHQNPDYYFGIVHLKYNIIILILHREEELTIAKSKSSHLSYSVVASLPLGSILSKISRYEADLSDFVVFIRIYQVRIIVKIMYLNV
jgi:hypothetical protein